MRGQEWGGVGGGLAFGSRVFKNATPVCESGGPPEHGS